MSHSVLHVISASLYGKCCPYSAVLTCEFGCYAFIQQRFAEEVFAPDLGLKVTRRVVRDHRMFHTLLARCEPPLDVPSTTASEDVQAWMTAARLQARLARLGDERPSAEPPHWTWLRGFTRAQSPETVSEILRALCSEQERCVRHGMPWLDVLQIMFRMSVDGSPSVKPFIALARVRVKIDYILYRDRPQRHGP